VNAIHIRIVYYSRLNSSRSYAQFFDQMNRQSDIKLQRGARVCIAASSGYTSLHVVHAVFASWPVVCGQ